MGVMNKYFSIVLIFSLIGLLPFVFSEELKNSSNFNSVATGESIMRIEKFQSRILIMTSLVLFLFVLLFVLLILSIYRK
jgi:hypothetical protein